ncbi:2-hydroxyacid dehydrogenase [Lutimaribacter marinistellae]|uniref:2-hydroxyacid dehydrogenase n=1 Tax=Lutimaribacter marinistellae TaxID=1820329 RepID=A0ABV7THC1_9RHOB
MALLIDIGHDGWMRNEDLAQKLKAFFPGADIRTREALGDPAEVTMVAVSRLSEDLPGLLPNLQLVQKLGAGVETIVAHPALPPHIRVTRLRPDAPAREIAEWFLAHILVRQRNLREYAKAQEERRWSPIEPAETPETTVGVLGLGTIGARSALLLRDLGYRVVGWSASPKSLEGVDCRHGQAALPDLLSECDHVCCILPSTPQTRDLFDAAMLARMKPGGTLLNAGRGDLIDEAALLAALAEGTPGHAVLDVTRTEPLPQDSPLWSDPNVTITPHVSGWHLGDALTDVAENYRRLVEGTPLLHEVDRTRGY